MVHPAIALLLTGILIIVVAIMLWPRRGLVPLVLRALRSGQRESTEDALKHLYDCEYRGLLGSIQSIAGSLELSTSKVAKLVERLEAMQLIRTEQAGLRLTSEGRSYALRILRIHRLWETFLAERTGFEEAEWHFQADRREHATSAAQLQQLVLTTGNPRFDPHGDPIPTEHGEVPAQRGQPLSDCEAGDEVMIVHVEDEPEAIYAQLRAQNVRVNQRITIMDKSSERIRIELDGEEQVMAPIVAGNVWVTPSPKGAPSDFGDRLSSLRIGESRTCVSISPACQGLQRRRLLDLGLVPGTEVTAVMKSPSGDPTGYRIRGAVIALRSDQADLIRVQRMSNGEDVS
jgi:DtxR family Mn-dependent transcriptional regulator